MTTKAPEIDKRQLWASRFKKGTDPRAKAYSESITVDRHMFYQDVWGSEAHTIMLGYTGINTDSQTKNILQGLQKVKASFRDGSWDLQEAEEDVHMNVERFVIDDVGLENGGRMHTTRSRNDQVVLDTKMYARDMIIEVQKELGNLIEVLLVQAKDHTETLMPGYTHVQHAQPITYAYWLTHYVAVFLRDLKRLAAAEEEVDTNPLGAGALTGTTFAIDRNLTTRLLGFSETQEHSMDAVTARDFNVQILSALSILFSSISRLADEIIYGITQEFGTLVLDDSFAMGSSMMPQKKNPGVLELVRARTGKMYGILMAMLTTLKALPSGYNRDYHEDKETMVEALNLAKNTLTLMAGVMETLKIKKERMKSLVLENYSAATELANYLVVVHNIPFRQCHRIVGYVVGELVEEGKTFEDKARTKQLFAEKDIAISDKDLDDYTNPKRIVERTTSLGGVAPKEVDRMIGDMNQKLKQYRNRIEKKESELANAKKETAQIIESILSGKTVKESVSKIVR